MVITTAQADIVAAFDPKNPARIEYVTEKSPRRFAGDESFPSGRYHIVALDEHGHDKGTLLGELSAYSRPAEEPLTLVSDLCEATEAKRYNLPEQAALLLVFGPDDCRSEKVKQALDAAAAEPARQDVFELDGPSGRSRAIRIPYAVEHTVIDNVVDLRLAETQAWFARAFGVERRHVFVNIPDRPDTSKAVTATMRSDHARLFPLPTRFVDMIPALLTPEVGGAHSVHKAIAVWMRLNGVSGLIYPSARMNCGVIVRSGKLTHFRGWNFVDYRGTTAPTSDGSIDLANWPDSLGEGVRIVYATNEEYAGSWRVEGYEELQASQRGQLVEPTGPAGLSVVDTPPPTKPQDPLRDMITAMAKAIAGDEDAKRYVTAAIRGVADSGKSALADGIARVLSGERDARVIAATLRLADEDQQIVAALVPPAPRPKLAPFAPSKLLGPEIPTLVEHFRPGPDWFLFMPGGQCLQIRCPQCGWEDTWDRGEEEAPEACPHCGFNTGPAAKPKNL